MRWSLMLWITWHNRNFSRELQKKRKGKEELLHGVVCMCVCTHVLRVRRKGRLHACMDLHVCLDDLTRITEWRASCLHNATDLSLSKCRSTCQDDKREYLRRRKRRRGDMRERTPNMGYISRSDVHLRPRRLKRSKTELSGASGVTWMGETSIQGRMS